MATGFWGDWRDQRPVEDQLILLRSELRVCEAYLSPKWAHRQKPTREQWETRKKQLEKQIERLTRPALTLVEGEK